MDRLPPALRTGSPQYGRGEGPNSQPPRHPRTYSSSSLASDLSSRHSSHDIGDEASIGSSNRYSHIAPSSPSFPGDTSYSPLVSQIESQGASPTFRRNRSLLSKLGSIRSSRFSTRSRYGVLTDEDTGPDLSSHSGRRRLGGLEEDEDEEVIGIDVSSFECPIALHNLSNNKPNIAIHEREGFGPDRAPATLGGGMNLVRTATVVEPPSQRGHKRGPSMTDPETRKVVQELAQSCGEILAFDAEPVVDISNFGGSNFSKRNTVASATTVDGENEMQKSYYFPEDPVQPAWRPFSMRWPYITLLIVTAVSLAGIQEFLCQLSLQREKHGDGLIQFLKAQDIPTPAYFAWKYMPTIILVSYGVMWQVTDYEIKRLEPYYQLSRRDGALASHSLNLDYLTFMSYLIPFRAIVYKQWAVVYSSTATLIAGGLLAVLQSASIDMKPESGPQGEEQTKNVVVNPVWSRSLEAALAIIAILGVLLLIQLRRKSGLLSDPKGIAGIAAMATKSHILNDFVGLDTAPNHIINKQLKNRRYNLHKSSLWQGEFIRSEDKVQAKKVENPHPIMLRLEAGILYMLYMAAFLCMLPLLLFLPNASIVTQKVPFLLTAISVSIKLLWGCLDINVRVIEPYYILSRRHAPPRTLTLDYTGTVPGYLSFKAMLNKHYLVALVGLGSILSEVLTVCATSFSVDGRTFISGHADDPGADGTTRYDTGETFKSFWISLAIAISILIYLITNAILVYAYRRHKFLPRQPGSIADTLAYIHQSRMLDDFVDTESFDAPAMTRHLEKLGKTYALGWFNGRDGIDHCGVDQEPILAPYEHGVDWAKGRLLGNGIGTWEHF